MTATPSNSDIALEAKVIGAVMSHPGLVSQATHLDSESFHDAGHAAIWMAVMDNLRSNKPLSPTSVYLNNTNQLDPHGGLDLLSAMAARGDSLLTSFPQAVDRLHDLSLWRRLAVLSSRLSSACQTQDKRPEEVIQGLGSVAQRILSDGRDTSKRKSEVARAALDAALQDRPIVTTGINSLDFLMQGGLQPGRLFGIGGLYGRGKTILLGTISENLNLRDEKHMFISLETDPVDIEIRSCARHINLNASTLYDKEDPEHGSFVSQAEDYLDSIKDNVIYEYAPGATINDIHRMILRARARHDIKGVIIDYWQLIRGRERGQNEESHLRHCADRLAALMRQQNMWGIMTAQLEESGRLKISDSLLQAASLFVRLVRDENEEAAFFKTEKSNYTRYADTGAANIPGMIFDSAGPHFRNTVAEDIPDIIRAQDDHLDV